MDIIYREVCPQDAEQFIKLQNLVWRNAYKHIFPEEVFKDRDDRAQEKIKNFSTNHFNNNERICYVAEHCGKIVGFMFGEIKATYEYYKNKGFADLVGLYIHPDFQHVGIGTSLKNIFIDWAKKNGATKFVIGVLKENTKARKTYEKWGGKLDAYTQPFVKLGKDYDEVFYTYELY